VLGGQRRIAERGHDELQPEAVVVLESQRVAVADGAVEPLLPEVERGGGGDGELERVDLAHARAAARGAGELEPGEDRARRALLVAEVEVVRLGRVEVDGLLDEAKAQQVRVERDVALGVPRDHRDVVQSRELHDPTF